MEDVSILGEGPFEFDDLRRFFHRVDLEAFAPDAYTEVLVLGEGGWTERDLQRLLRQRSGQTLRVYSQQMFLAYLISRNDPLDTPKIALRLGRGHPGLELLQSLGFEWPTTKVKKFGGSASDSTAWRSEGFLKAVGYRVGLTVGNRPRERRKALAHAYRARVPKRFGSEYVNYWGPTRSSLRLERMATSLARFCRMATGRQSGDFSLACRQWERDLRWLKRRYYDGNYRFNWPSTSVW